jgi:hypothetical protein
MNNNPSVPHHPREVQATAASGAGSPVNGNGTHTANGHVSTNGQTPVKIPGGWFAVPNALIRRYGPRLGMLGYTVYGALAYHANREGKCWPKLSRIAEEFGISERSVIRGVSLLEDLGVISVARFRDGKSPNVYTLLPFLPTGDCVSPLPLSHPTDDYKSPQRVTVSHPTGDLQSPEQYPQNNTHLNHTQEPHPGGQGRGLKKGSVPPQETEDFRRFWAEYPRKVGKVKALDAWLRLAPDVALVEKIMEVLRKDKRSRQWTKDNGEYIPHPTTWLNRRRWEDGDDARPASGGTNSFEFRAEHAAGLYSEEG